MERSLQQISMQCLCTRSPCEVSWQDLRTRSLEEVSWQDPWKGPLDKILTDLYAISLYTISFWNLCTNSLEEFYRQALCKIPLGKISATDLYAMSLCKTSIRGVLPQDLYTRIHGKTLEKISERDLHILMDLELRSLLQLSINDLWATSLLSSPSICTRSLRGLLARSMYIQDLYEGSVGKISVQAP